MGQNSNYVLTLGYFGSPYAVQSVTSPSPSSILEEGFELRSKPAAYHLKLLQLSD